jgi:hypothetical protein
MSINQSVDIEEPLHTSESHIPVLQRQGWAEPQWRTRSTGPAHVLQSPWRKMVSTHPAHLASVSSWLHGGTSSLPSSAKSQNHFEMCAIKYFFKCSYHVVEKDALVTGKGYLALEKFTCVSFSSVALRIFFCCFWDQVTLCSPNWPWTQDLPASASWVLRIQVCTIWWVLRNRYGL